MNRGVVYAAIGEEYVKEVRKSIMSLREHMPDIHVTVISDREINYDEINDVIVKNDCYGHYGDSIIDIDQLPYERGLYLDTDTIICGDLSSMFDILDRFDIACSITPGVRYYSSSEIPTAFPLYNTGVFVWKKSDDTIKFFQEWKETYLENLDESEDKFNQPSFRKALYYSDMRIATLPQEYNCFIIRPGQLCDKAMIIHGRHPRIEKIVELINEYETRRCYVPYSKSYPIEMSYPGINDHTKVPIRYKIRHLRDKGLRSLSEKGFKKTVKKAVNKYVNV